MGDRTLTAQPSDGETYRTAQTFLRVRAFCSDGGNNERNHLSSGRNTLFWGGLYGPVLHSILHNKPDSRITAVRFISPAENQGCFSKGTYDRAEALLILL